MPVTDINNYAPQPNANQGGCCCECYSSSIGDSQTSQNPIQVPDGSSGQDAALIANKNPSRKEIFLINTSASAIVYIGLGYKPTTTSYSIALTNCTTSDDDGTGGIWVSDIWQGPIYALGSASGGKCNLTEEV